MSRTRHLATGSTRVGLTVLEAAFLVLLWVALWGTWSFANLAGGVAVAAALVILLPTPHRPSGRTRVRPLQALVFAGFFVAKLVQANLHMAWTIVNPWSTSHSGIVAVPIRGCSDGLTTVVANFVTLTPGTLTLDVRTEPPTLYIHVMRLGDPDEVRRDVLRIEALAIRAFGSPEALTALRAESHDGPNGEVGR